MAWIELDGAVNVRDLGDLPTEDGQKTARASLLRADNLQELSPADVTKLVRDIGVTTVVDLRSSNELAAEGPAPLDAVAGVRHAHHPVLPEVGSSTDVIADALLARDRLDRTRYPTTRFAGTTSATWRTARIRWSGRCAASRTPGGGGGPLRRGQGPDRRGGGARAHRGRGTRPGRGGRLRGHRGAHRGHHGPAAQVAPVRPRHHQQARRPAPAPGRDDGRVPRADGRALRRGRVVADRSRPIRRGTWTRCGSSSGQALEREGRGDAQLHVTVARRCRPSR